MEACPLTHHRGVGRWFGKGGLYRSIGKGSMISVYKLEPSHVTIRKHRGAPAPIAPMVPTPMHQSSSGWSWHAMARELIKVYIIGAINMHDWTTSSL